MSVLDNEADHFTERNFSNKVALPSGMERNGLDGFGQHGERGIAVLGGKKVEPSVAVVTPMGDTHGVLFVQLVECGAKFGNIADELCRTSDFAAFVAKHSEPENYGPGVVASSGVKCDDRNFMSIVEDAKVFLLEIANGQPGLRILSDHVH
jgi:hypothetical protein